MRQLILGIVAIGLILSGCIGQGIGQGGSSQGAPVCGNGILESGEQCDAGIPCQNSSYVCDISCKCVPPKAEMKTVSCADNSMVVSNGTTNPFDSSSMICQDDCSRLGPNATCDSATCTCHILTPANQTNATSPARCGDGVIQPPEQCDPGSNGTAACQAGSTCSSNCSCVPLAPPPGPMHAVCDYVHHACVLAPGAGFDECQNDSGCVNQPHCGNGVREGPEQCDGGDRANCAQGQLCDISCQCVNQTLPGMHLECKNNACVEVPGYSPNQCKNDSDCIVPTLDCPSYCSSQGYSQSLGSGYTTAAACSLAAQEPQVSCYTTCTYSKFYSISSQAGTASCCCKEVNSYKCSNCPGQAQCQVCPATKP